MCVVTIVLNKLESSDKDYIAYKQLLNPNHQLLFIDQTSVNYACYCDVSTQPKMHLHKAALLIIVVCKSAQGQTTQKWHLTLAWCERVVVPFKFQTKYVKK